MPIRRDKIGRFASGSGSVKSGGVTGGTIQTRTHKFKIPKGFKVTGGTRGVRTADSGSALEVMNIKTGVRKHVRGKFTGFN